jgi:hypothetical protein
VKLEVGRTHAYDEQGDSCDNSVTFSLANKCVTFLFNSNRYPPYSEKKLHVVELLTKKRKLVSLKCLPYVLMFALGFAVAYGVSAIVKVITNSIEQSPS